MTFLVGAIAILLSGALVLGAADVARALIDRCRAQTAADAAALAAASDSALGGTGLPAESADEYARLNGARLVHCLCEPGATAAQVEVIVGDASATARAVFDPDRVLPAGDWASGLDPRFASAVQRLLAAGRGRIFVVSGARTTAQQQMLWTSALDRYGDPEVADDWVARPGSSAHERGTAVDLGGDLALAARLVGQLRLPLTRPLPHEPWHFEPA